MPTVATLAAVTLTVSPPVPQPETQPAPQFVSPDGVELLAHVQEPTFPHRMDRWPLYKTILYTMDISARFLARMAIGQGTVACADHLIDGYWRRIMKSGNASLRVIGREHFQPGQPYVVMSNHCSILDIPALMGSVPGSLRMVTKQELTRVPLWGHALLASGFIPIDRQNRDKAIAQLDKAKQVLKQGVSVWISPEGTRARNTKLGAFKKGGFHVAMGLGVPIIPCWLEGPADIIPPDQFVAHHDGQVCVSFGAPRETVGADMGELMTQVRNDILHLSGRPHEMDGLAT